MSHVSPLPLPPPLAAAGLGMREKLDALLGIAVLLFHGPHSKSMEDGSLLGASWSRGLERVH